MSQSPQEKDVIRRQGQPLDAEVQREIDEALGDMSLDDLLAAEEAGKAADKAAAGPVSAPGVRRGRVIAIEARSVLLDLGGKSQGVIPLEQFEEAPPRVGDTVEGVFDRYDGSEGLVHLSRKGAVAAAAWETLQEGQTIEGRVTGVNKGGLELDVQGIRAFMPASQVDLYHVEDVSVYLNERLRCQVTDLDRGEKNLVVSRRALLELEKEQAREKMWTELDAGQVREGVVRNIMPYGAFVDLGGVDGLLHISDLAWGRVAKVEDVVAQGQKLTVKVLKLDRDTRKVSLGLKQLEPDPWTTVATRVSPGMIVDGTVTRLADFGAFVQVEPGVEGLAPVSELGWGHVKHPREMLDAGQTHKFLVLSVESDRKRISLSLKQAQSNPWLGASGRYAPEQMVAGKVTRIADFGAFVELEPGIEGLVHVSQLSDKRVRHPGDVVKEGQEVTARILSVDEEGRKVSLSLKSPEGMSGQTEPARPGAPAAPPPPKKKRDKPLKGGLERPDGSFGLGDLKLPGM